MISLRCGGCRRDEVYALMDGAGSGGVLSALDWQSFNQASGLDAGCELASEDGGKALFQLVAFDWRQGGTPGRVPLLKALKDIPAGEIRNLRPVGEQYSLAVITLSDKSARGEREDKSGPEIIRALKDFLKPSLIRAFIIPDEAGLLKALLADLAYNQKIGLIITTGGTGIGERDITAQVTGALLDADLPGFSQAVMQASLLETPNAMLSRARAGLMGRTLVINLPGSLKAVKCGLKAVMPALKHALAKARGDNSDCGGN